MPRRSFTRMEQIGIYALIIMAVITVYSRFIYPGAGRKFNRVKNEYAKMVAQVGSLKQEQKSGRLERKIRTLKKQVRKATLALKDAEKHLATNKERDGLGARILQLAGLEGLMIRNYNRITDQAIIRELTQRQQIVQSACYRIILDGTFNRVFAFLRQINEMDKIITMRRLHIGMSEKDKLVQLEVWVTF